MIEADRFFESERRAQIESLRNLSRSDIASNENFRKIEATSQRVQEISSELAQTVFGQQEACDALAKSIVISETGLASPDRPRGIFIFLGPTGVGKTEMAKALAKRIAREEGTEDHWERNFIGIDCTDLQEGPSLTKLSGTSASWVGYGDETLITPRRLREGAVVCFDEIEKAHPSIINWLLPVLDKGKTEVFLPTGEQNRAGVRAEEVGPQTLDFTSSYIVMTSNVGAGEIQQKRNARPIGFRMGEAHTEEKRTNVQEAGLRALREHFRNIPEFLGRVGSFNSIAFKDLGSEDYEKIYYKFINEINSNQEMADPNNFHPIQTTREYMDYVFSRANRQEWGARNVRQAIEVQLLPAVADLKTSNVLPQGAPLIADIEDGKITFHTMNLDLSPQKRSISERHGTFDENRLAVSLSQELNEDDMELPPIQTPPRHHIPRRPVKPRSRGDSIQDGYLLRKIPSERPMQEIQVREEEFNRRLRGGFLLFLGMMVGKTLMRSKR